MRSTTSYFNGALYRKTMARFWPLWAGYGVIWMFILPLNLLNNFLHGVRFMGEEAAQWRLELALEVPALLQLGVIAAPFFAILCVMAVFGYLYNGRSSCWFHALPMRREALFCTQYMAGLSFLLLPQLAAAVLTAVVEMSFLSPEHWGAVLGALLTWLLAQSGICLFFFSFASFCAMFTGHILALPAFYGIFNALATVIYDLLDGLMHQFFFGYAGSPGAERVVEYLTPFIVLCRAIQPAWYDGSMTCSLTSPGAVAAYALVGVLLAVVSLYVYRRRHAETAGDVVAIPLVRPLFKYGVSFCAGLCFGMFTTAFFGWSVNTALIPCILVWTVIGYFVAEMLLRKSFRVLKTWKGGAVMAGVMLLLCLTCVFDFLGVVTRVPGLGQVKELTVYFEMGYPSDSGQKLNLTLTDPQQIQKFLDLHQAIVDDRDRVDWDGPNHQTGNDYIRLQLWYSLEGGGRLNRNYSSVSIYLEDLDREGSVTWLAQQLIQDPGLTAQAYGLEDFLTGRQLAAAYLTSLSSSGISVDYDPVYLNDYARELWEAVQLDFAEGNLGARYLFDMGEERRANTYLTDLHFESLEERTGTSASGETAPSSRLITITLTPQARHTLAVLDKTGIWEQGYALAPWEDSGGAGGTITYPSFW